jgi:hypothetical protein
MAKPSSERDHSRSKHKARWRRPALERTEKDDDEHAAWRKKYYRGPRPDIDPQSTVSKGLEALGLDEPYREDDASYDYRRRKFDESVAAGTPDMSWFLPRVVQEGASEDIAAIRAAAAQVPRDIATAVIAGPQRDRISSTDVAELVLQNDLGREPTPDEIYNFLTAIGDDEVARQNFRDAYGREPTDEEWAKWQRLTTDPRTRDEKMAGMALKLNPLDLFGFADEASAGVNTLLGGNYDDELAKARKIAARQEILEDPWSWRNVIADTVGTGAGFVGPVLGSFRAFEAGVRGLRGAARLAPEATTRLGKMVSAGAAGGPAAATDLTAMQFGSGEGGFEKRWDSIDPNLVASAAIGGGVLWPLIGAGTSGIYKGAKKAMGAGSALLKRFGKPKPKPKPGTPPKKPGILGDEPLPKWPDRAGPTPEPRMIGATGTPPWRVSDRQGVRNAIGQAMRPVPGAGVAVGAGAFGGAGVMAYKAAEERRKKRRK